MKTILPEPFKPIAWGNPPETFKCLESGPDDEDGMKRTCFLFNHHQGECEFSRHDVRWTGLYPSSRNAFYE